MTISQDTLIRFVYGELSPDEARRVTIELERDPALRALVDEQRKLRAHFEVGREAQSGPKSTSDAAASAPAAARGWPLSMLPLRGAAAGRNLVGGIAMLAGLVLGILLAASLGLGSDISKERGALIAGSALASTLSSQMSGRSRSGIVIVSSFWSTRDSFCRSFVMEGRVPNALAGVACRERGVWRIVALADAALQEPNASATGEADLPPLIGGAIAAIIAGEPLAEDGERAARSQNWRPR
jgi:hypothetical protein